MFGFIVSTWKMGFVLVMLILIACIEVAFGDVSTAWWLSCLALKSVAIRLK